MEWNYEYQLDWQESDNIQMKISDSQCHRIVAGLSLLPKVKGSGQRLLEVRAYTFV